MESNLNYGTLLLELDITALLTRANSQTGALDPHSSDMHPILGEGGEGGRSADGQYRFSLVVPLHTNWQHKHLHTNWQPLLFTNWWVARPATGNTTHNNEPLLLRVTLHRE